MHPEHLDLRGEKMSKSLGNVIGVPDLLAKHRVDEVRWFYAMSHYRSKLTFGDDLLDAAKEGYAKITRLMRILEGKLSQATDEELRIPAAGLYASQREEAQRAPRLRHQYAYGRFGEASVRMMQRFSEALDDDLNSPQATAALFDYVNELYSAGIEAEPGVPDVLAAYRCLARHLYVLGCEFPHERLDPELWVECFPAAGDTAGASAPYRAVIDALLTARQEARQAKDFAKSDLIRDLLAGAGVAVEDTPQGPRWELAD
jgi:cysteinyl-tRNA synthetase